MENLLLLPGMLCDERLWAAQIDGLRGRRRDIVVGDITRADTMEAIAREVLRDAPERFALAGFSMGGMVALEMWRQAGGERITRLALLDTNAHAELPERGKLRDDLIARAYGGEFREVVTEELKPLYLAERNRRDQPLLDSVFAMAMRLGAEVFERQCRALQTRADSEALLPRINAPTLLLCGAEDRLCPVAAHEKMAAAIAGSELVVIESCGHLSPMEAPEQVNQAMSRWLQT